MRGAQGGREDAVEQHVGRSSEIGGQTIPHITDALLQLRLSYASLESRLLLAADQKRASPCSARCAHCCPDDEWSAA